MRKFLMATAVAAATLLAAPLAADHHMTAPELTAALAQANRAEDRARDQFRHPAETLAFFGVKPGMTVADYMPSGGWYTRVLVPYLGASGSYIGLNPDGSTANNTGFTEYAAKLTPRFKELSPAWSLSGAPVMVHNSNELEPMNGTVDRVLIFREMHNLLRNGMMHQELTRMRALLKDDGMLGIVQHRAKPWANGDYTDGSKGYLRQSDVIGLVEAHGFALVGTSEVNANPMDAANHEKGVWEMPPVLGSKRDDLKNMGESDRMTLLFRKR
ncbi:class I SAM-dependent methyltransferase [Qipengyuania marisflavi]|uniref:Class I SAM-dependent methyltransferase n=1 Tax=Qipengyuania marisflavi TaxID=2486356 RepID=A0A5S3P2W0_9SPHN|nr:class I SAM-dependent methyltransferase [Qipengyuania marisflavi]TMM47128.1 class I SAM-dependent methyltransferase [Qipengyuania marisflavi]